jgi:hypothetical protein
MESKEKGYRTFDGISGDDNSIWCKCYKTYSTSLSSTIVVEYLTGILAFLANDRLGWKGF